MPETTGAAATDTNGFSVKSFLIGAFAAAAIGGAGLVSGIKYGDDIRAVFNTPETVVPVTPQTTEPAAPETVQTLPKTAPVLKAEPAPMTQDQLQALLTEALDNEDIKGIKHAIALGAQPNIMLATAAKVIAEEGENESERLTQYTERRGMLLRAGVSPSETLAQTAFNPYFRDALPGLAAIYAYNERHTQAALNIAAANNDLEGFETLLDETIFGKRTAKIDADNFEALRVAAENGSTYIMQYGLDWDTENNGGMFVYENGFDLLYDAMHRGDALMVDVLVEADAHLMIPSHHITSVFEQSAEFGYLPLYTAMIEDLGMDVTIEARLDDGTYMHSYAPSLIAAAESGYVEIGRAAIKAGAHPSSWKGTPAIRAAIAGNLDFIEMLRSGHKKADFRLQSGEAYIQAVQLGHDDIARFMISEQAELLDIRNGAGFNHAYRTGNLELFTFMLEQGGTAYKDVLNKIIDDNNLEFAKAVFEQVTLQKDGTLPAGTWNAIKYRMSEEMSQLLGQYPAEIRPTLDPDAINQFLTGPEL